MGGHPPKMSKLSREHLRQHIAEMYQQSAEKKRNFVETIELQISLKNYDPTKDKRFSGTVRLPSAPKAAYKVCILADAAHIEEATKYGIPYLDVEALKAMKKSTKAVRALAKQYDAFLASDTLIKQIPKLLGPGLSKAGKFPTLLNHDDSMVEKIAELQSTIKFQMKKVLCLALAVSNLKNSPEETEKNIVTSINFLVSLLKKNWQNVKSLTIKTTMGKPHHIY
eukprot:c5141_g1_i1.p2 GENE.c5141_g1_i1~~c5141_g1_i1.p2  ORF type:complete len:224 (-),score=64.88 c5141_g1_i1:99-770(-)